MQVNTEGFSLCNLTVKVGQGWQGPLVFLSRMLTPRMSSLLLLSLSGRINTSARLFVSGMHRGCNRLSVRPPAHPRLTLSSSARSRAGCTASGPSFALHSCTAQRDISRNLINLILIQIINCTETLDRVALHEPRSKQWGELLATQWARNQAGEAGRDKQGLILIHCHF